MACSTVCARVGLPLWLLLSIAGVSPAAELDALRTHRKDVFEFTEKPGVVRNGDTVTISFAVKDYCDVTVAVEDAKGRIIRHLASGVLGRNAPPPFKKDALRQSLVWDSKTDKEQYVDRNAKFTVRVSLGLKPQLERSLYWSPHKLVSYAPSLMAAAPEGVYVYDAGSGRGSFTPWLRLLDHDGRYVHTLYPFPASDVEKVEGLNWVTYPPDNRRFPLKTGLGQCTLLPMSDDSKLSLVVGKDHVYLIGDRVQMIAKPGSGKPSKLNGPRLATSQAEGRDRVFWFKPAAGAISPDGRWLYLTAYCGSGAFREYMSFPDDYLPCVMRMPADLSEKPTLLIGGTTIIRDKAPAHPPADSVLVNPTAIACDKDGRIHVADIGRDMLLVFSPDGKLLHEVKTSWPQRISISPKTGEIWVTCWALRTAITFWANRAGESCATLPRHLNDVTLRQFSPCQDNAAPRPVAACPLPPVDRGDMRHQHQATMDTFSPSPRLWFAPTPGLGGGNKWETCNTRILELKDGKLGTLADFHAWARRDVVQTRPPRYGRQRPYVNPADGCVYIAEQIYPTVVADVQCFDQLVKINPNTGGTSIVGLPFDTEDLAFDIDGRAYLRTESVVARYDSTTWREVPFDYGDELPGVSHYGLHPGNVISGTLFHGGRGASGKLGGMSVNAKGDIACWFYSTSASSVELDSENPEAGRGKRNQFKTGGQEWQPQIFPGRSTDAFIHIWDKHGKMKVEDAVPGIAECTDIKMDKDNNLYLLAGAQSQFDGKVYPNPLIGSLIKVAPKAAKILSTRAPVALGPGSRPKRAPDWTTWNSASWLEGGAWIYGGVGGSAASGICKCHCEANSGMAIDYFARSFATAFHRFDVVVLDSAGNDVVRIGRYGNVEDGVPLVKDGGPANPRSIGGDETTFISPKWMAVESDHRLFVADRGNHRVASIRLGYHAEERVAVEPQ